MYYYDDETPRKIICRLMGIALIVTLFVGIRHFVVEPAKVVTEAYESVHAGEIVDKKIINAHSSLFTSSDTDYRLIIEAEYDYNGETKKDKKSISVDKETYKSANIGDYFDSHSLTVTKSEQTTSLKELS